MAYAKKTYTAKGGNKASSGETMKLVGHAVRACVYPRNHMKEREFTRKDGSTFTRPAMYAIDLVLSGKYLANAERLGFDERNIREPNEWEAANGYDGPFLSFTQLYEINGEETRPPKVADADTGESITDNIGNGSLVEVEFIRKKGNSFDKYGYNLYLKAINVRELVEWEPEEKGPAPEETTKKRTSTPAPIASRPIKSAGVKAVASKGPKPKDEEEFIDDDVPFDDGEEGPYT